MYVICAMAHDKQFHIPKWNRLSGKEAKSACLIGRGQGQCENVCSHKYVRMQKYSRRLCAETEAEAQASMKAVAEEVA